jgi:hypothetical protein
VRSARQRQHREARLHRGRSSITQCAAAHVRRFMPPPNGGSAQRRCPWAYAVAWVDERSCRAVVVLLGSRAPSARTLEAAVQSARCARGNRPRQIARRHRMRANMPSTGRRQRWLGITQRSNGATAAVPGAASEAQCRRSSARLLRRIL